MRLKPPDRIPTDLPVGFADLEYVAGKLDGKKDVCISDVRIEIFDLLDADDREKCRKVEKEVLEKLYAGVITLGCDKTEKMQRSDGSTTWMRLIKWVEYGLEDD